MIQTPMIETPSQIEPKIKPANDISKKEATVFLLSGALISLLYAVCFNGYNIFPQISFTLFCPITFACLTFILNYLGYLKNKKAIMWGVPIIIASVFNGLFDLNIFSYLNVMLMHLLFAVYMITAIREQPFELFGLSTLKVLVLTMCGNTLLIFDIFKVLTGNKQTKSSNSVFKKVLIGMFIALPVLLVITALLVSADMVFDRIMGGIINRLFNFELIDISFLITFIAVLAYTVGYVYRSKKVSKENYQINIKLLRADVVISATFLVLVNAVFLIFSIVQIAYLFGGGLMELPQGMVYSQYAREGFFQLLFVTVINFSVIFIFINLLTGVQECKPLRILLLMLCVFTGMLIISSFYRMYLYIGVYGHTILRLWVITFLVMEVFLIILTVCKLFNNKIPYTKWFITTAVIFYFIVNITGSDYFATRLNVNNFLSGRIDSIDVNSVGTDGLHIIKTLMESDLYICVNNKIINKSGSIDYSKEEIRTYEEIVERIYLYNEHWQNWSYFKNK